MSDLVARCEVTFEGLQTRVKIYGDRPEWPPSDSELQLGDRYESHSGCTLGDRALASEPGSHLSDGALPVDPLLPFLVVLVIVLAVVLASATWAIRYRRRSRNPL